MSRPVILFDGVCHLCNGMVRFVLRHDVKAHFDFAALQSEFGQSVLNGSSWDSIVLLEAGQRYETHEAVLRILSRLRGPWPWIAQVIELCPEPILAWGYRTIARHRYRIFGKYDTCALPREEWKNRFL